ncbi:MAG: sulfite oxidase, partial [Chloroflexi bacterium]|nr:sulfite oxidase [Chloroflexota bacterium]
MSERDVSDRFPAVADGKELEPGDSFYKEEVQLALRNRGMPLE